MRCIDLGGCHRSLAVLGTAAASVFALSTGSYALDIQGVLPAAFDQPRINIAVEVNGQIRNEAFGMFLPLEAFLDTGASSILISSEWADNVLELNRAMHNGEKVRFGDVGVGGTEFFDVSDVLKLYFAPYAGNVDSYTFDPLIYNQALNNVRAQIGSPPNDIYDPLQWLLAQLNVAGMPVMQGKVVVMDPKPVNNAIAILSGDVDFDDLQEITMRAYLYDKPAAGQSNPNIPKTDYTIKLSYGSFDAYTVTTPSGAPGPNLAHNPFVGPAPSPEPGSDQNAPPVEFSYNGLTATGSLLLDTGASLSAISTRIAAELGLTVEQTPSGPVIHGLAPGAAQLTATVMGVGGAKTIPGFYLDEMLLRTLEGTAMTGGTPDEMDIRFIGAPVYILDIALARFEGDPEPIVLDGLLGMNFFVASTWFESSGLDFTFLDAAPSAWDMIVFDEVDGTLGLRLIPEPASMALLGLTGLLLRRRRVSAN